MGQLACAHCTATFEARTPSAKYCFDCVPRDTKGGMKYRQNITLYGVDKVMYDAMYFDQDGQCPVCEDREAEVVDHCHRTGRVRGLLCRACNTMLGMIEDAKRLTRALDYVGEGVY